MSMPYIDGDTLADAKNALGCGVSIDLIAAKLGVSEAHLRRLLRLPREPIRGDLFADQPQCGGTSER